MLKYLRKLFNNKPKWLSSNFKYVIEEAFEWNGKTYYSCADFTNIPSERAFQAIAYYNELDMRVDRNFLIGHVEAIEKMVNSSTVKLTDIVKLTTDLKSRLNLAYDPDLLYKLASVVFFDEKEDPLRYDFEYNRKKIKEWKEKGLDSFFLNVPLNRLLPSCDFSKLDSEQFMKMSQLIRELTVEQIESILSANSSNQNDSDTTNNLRLQAEELKQLLQSEI